MINLFCLSWIDFIFFINIIMDILNKLKNFFTRNKETINILAEEFQQIELDINLYKQQNNGVLPPEIVDRINAYIQEQHPVIRFGFKQFKLTALLSKVTPDDKAFSEFLKTPEGIKAGSVLLPKTYNLTQILLPIRDQGRTNCCVAFATSTVIEYKNIIEKKYLDYMSPSFIYNNRYDTTKDEGMDSKDSINIVKNMGVATDKIFPMSMLNKSIQPNIYELALNYKIYNSYYITNLNDLKTAIFNTGPIIAILPVYIKANLNTFWINPTKTKTVDGGYHCITFVGYDDISERLILRNSWGTNWGINGYQWFPYSDFDIIVEAWALLPVVSTPNESVYLSNSIGNDKLINTDEQIIGLDPVLFYSLLAGIVVFIIMIIIIIIIRYKRQNK